MSAAYVLVCPECGATVLSKNIQACPACKSPKPVPDSWHADEWLGKTVQSYSFQRRLGSGGYGKVYEVAKGRFGKETRALKLISKDLFAGNDGKRVRERFEREAEVLIRLDHPHIVRCYDFGAFEEANWVYMELDLALGRSLYQRVWPPNADEPACLSVQEALLMGHQLADALAYAHGEGILHRDLSHNNVMLDGHGEGLKVKLIDFGLAKQLDDAKPGTRGEGTTNYMAPEQFQLGAVSDAHDVRLDLYQLGGLLHFALTGQPPYSEQPGPSGTTIAVQQKLRQGGPGPAPSEQRPELAREAPALDALIARLLSTSPQDRPNSAAEVLAQLGKLQQALHPSRPQRLAPQIAIDLGAAPTPRQPTQPEPQPAPPPTPDPIPSARLTQPEPPPAPTPRVPTQREPLPVPPDAPPKPVRPALQHTSHESTPATSSEPLKPPYKPFNTSVSLGTLGLFGLVASLVTFGMYRAIQDKQSNAEVLTQAPPQSDQSTKRIERPTSDPAPNSLTSKDEPDPKTRYSGMVYVPESNFTRGSNSGDLNEKPVRDIYLSEYWIDTYEVTVDQYRACVDAGKCSKPDTSTTYCSGKWADRNNWTQNRGEHPVNCVSWTQANQYCRWAGKRLPTEAQWEKAARGTDGRTYPWGEQKPTCEYAVMNDGGNGCGEGTTWPVGLKPKGVSPYGAHDMSGNVWEWAQDCYDSGYYNNAPSKDPKNDCDHNSASRRVDRGGNWLYRPVHLREAYRYGNTREVADVFLGVRCARSIE